MKDIFAAIISLLGKFIKQSNNTKYTQVNAAKNNCGNIQQVMNIGVQEITSKEQPPQQETGDLWYEVTGTSEEPK